MREIKIRYRLGKAGGFSAEIILSIDKFQNHDDCICKLLSEGWVIHAREQFTGLKDKNGKEIYEGDVLRIRNNNGYTFRGYVLWSVDFCCWELMIIPKDKTESQISFDQIIYKKMEVIGNIYENTELLGEIK